MSNEPLDPENSTDKQEGAGETRVLNIDNLHLHANEIDSLRRLADKDPELARIVVNQKDRFSRRDHGSYRFGVVAAVVFILGLMVTLSFVLVELGLLLSLIMLVMTCHGTFIQPRPEP
ncbi:hypothetical protein, partial [Marinovum sp. PR37]